MELSIPFIRRLAEGKDPQSISNKFRARRFQRFESLVTSLPRPLKILDVGGTNQFWENRGWADRSDIQIFSLNLTAEEKRHENITPLAGDATNLAQFPEGSFEVGFSNSVIEHLFSLEQQERMASEIRRVCKSYWVQTPNYWFPMEPHFHVPGWQWLPLAMRVAIIRRWRCGWRGPYQNVERAHQMVSEVRLMTGRELQSLFPDAKLLPERFCGMVKSWVAIGGAFTNAL